MTIDPYPGYDRARSGRRPPPPTPAPSSTGPWVLGSAGGGLVDAAWAANADVAKIGRAGELRTAAVLDPLTGLNGAAVLHDLQIPIPGFKANIDHVFVSGNTVLIIDTKVWRAGFFWSFGGRAYRGMRRFTSAEKKTMSMARDRLAGYLRERGLQADLLTPVVAVWPSKDGASSTFWAMNYPGAKVIPAADLEKRVQRVRRNGPANAILVSTLSQLLNAPPPHPHAPTRFDDF
jgi:hypothetical protein